MPAPLAPLRNRIIGHGDVAPRDLLANPRNWRAHPDAQKDAIEGTLEEVGWVRDVLVNKTTGFVVDGHARVAIAIKRHEPTVPVSYCELTPEEEALILATLDPISAMAGTDERLLEELVHSMHIDDARITALLDDLVPPAPSMETDEAIPEPPAVPITEKGDLIQLGRHRLLCGDSTRAEDIARLMAARRADLVFTDPPYGVGYDGGAKKREKLAGDEVGTTIYADALPHLRIAAADHAALYLWYADGHAAAAAAAGYVITAQIIWLKNNAQFVTSAHYKGKHEPCFYAHRKGKTARWVGPNNEVTVWEVDRAHKNEYHPTQKPVELAARAIRNSSNRGDAVLDMFAGSGSTLIACEAEGRTCYAMELDASYCDVIVARWEALTNLKAERLAPAAVPVSST